MFIANLYNDRVPVRPFLFLQEDYTWGPDVVSAKRFTRASDAVLRSEIALPYPVDHWYILPVQLPPEHE